MVKTLRGLMVIVFMLGVGLSACNLSAPECPDMPASWAASAFMNIHITPDSTGTQVTLTWIYPGTCLPDHFRIIINDIPYMGGGVLYNEDVTPLMPGPTIVYEDGTTAVGFSWTTEETFVDGLYFWWVIPYSGDYRGESSPAYEIWITTVYPDDLIFADWWCPEENWRHEELIQPVYPANESTIHTLTPSLIWRDRNHQLTRCNAPFSMYMIFYSQETENLDLREILSTQPPGIRYPWQPGWVNPPGVSVVIGHYDVRSVNVTLTECRRTYWKIYNYFLQSDMTQIVFPTATYYFDIDPAMCEGERPPEFFIPPSESAPPMARVLEPANCRSGPSMDYQLLSILPAGNEYEIQARNTPGDSWMVFDPSINNTCWVADDLVEVVGDTGLVMVIDPDPPMLLMPTGTPASVDCSQWSTNQNACVANPTCTWQPNLHPSSPCVNK
jgi:hypothetical protein